MRICWIKIKDGDQMKQKEKVSGKKLTNVSIPKSLFEKIRERIRGTEFTSVSDYVTYVLGEVLAEDEGETESSVEKDEEQIKARLKALGYID